MVVGFKSFVAPGCCDSYGRYDRRRNFAWMENDQEGLNMPMNWEPPRETFTQEDAEKQRARDWWRQYLRHTGPEKVPHPDEESKTKEE